jgi:hypothetical protein
LLTQVVHYLLSVFIGLFHIFRGYIINTSFILYGKQNINNTSNIYYHPHQNTAWTQNNIMFSREHAMIMWLCSTAVMIPQLLVQRGSECYELYECDWPLVHDSTLIPGWFRVPLSSCPSHWTLLGCICESSIHLHYISSAVRPSFTARNFSRTDRRTEKSKDVPLAEATLGKSLVFCCMHEFESNKIFVHSLCHKRDWEDNDYLILIYFIVTEVTKLVYTGFWRHVSFVGYLMTLSIARL